MDEYSKCKLTIDCCIQFKEQAKQQVFVDPWSLWYSIAVHVLHLLLALIASQLSASRNQLLPAADFFSAAS